MSASMSHGAKELYEFGPFRIDPDKEILLRAGEPVPLTPKTFQILLVLVRHSQEVVTKDDLMKMVWPDTFVEEANLSRNIFMLRKALGESAQDHRYIVTVPGPGIPAGGECASCSGRGPYDRRGKPLQGAGRHQGDEAVDMGGPGCRAWRLRPAHRGWSCIAELLAREGRCWEQKTRWCSRTLRTQPATLCLTRHFDGVLRYSLSSRRFSALSPTSVFTRF